MNRSIVSKFTRLYRKIFRSNGVLLGEPRQYVIGDDTSLINWKATAKSGNIFVDNQIPDHGNDIIFVLDISESTKFGSKIQSKISLSEELITQLASLAVKYRDKVGLVIFSDKIEQYVPPTLKIGLLSCAIDNHRKLNKKFQTNLAEPLNLINKFVQKRSSIIVICDIFALFENRKEVLSGLHMLCSRHEVIMFILMDDCDMLRAGAGRVVIEDLETGEIFEIDTNNSAVMSKIAEKYAAYKALICRDIQRIGVKVFEANTKNSSSEFFSNFFTGWRQSRAN